MDRRQLARVLAVVRADLRAVHGEVEERATLLRPVLHLHRRRHVGHERPRGPVQVDREERAPVVLEGLPSATALVDRQGHLGTVHPAGVRHAGVVVEALLGTVLAAHSELPVGGDVAPRALV